MALISCPECGKQISETTPSCPHCGYRLSSESTANIPTQTKIGQVKTNPLIGIILMGLGFIGIFFSFLFGPFFILPMIGAALFIMAGYGQLIGMQPVVCPHCGKQAQIICKSENFKCSACKKRSVKKGEYLYPVI